MTGITHLNSIHENFKSMSKKYRPNAYQTDINRLNREIDALVYELYGLTEEEIKIVEGESAI